MFRRDRHEDFSATRCSTAHEQKTFDKGHPVLAGLLHHAPAGFAAVFALPGGTHKRFVTAGAFTSDAPPAVLCRHRGMRDRVSAEGRFIATL